MTRNVLLNCVSLLGLALAAPALAQGDRFQALADLPFVENRPTPETAETLRQELAFQQATQAYLWALPLINTLGMMYGSEETFGSGYNVLPIWKQRLDPKTLVTTPNSDVLYAMSYVDMTETGPIVLEAPEGLQGILLDFWQRPIPVDGGEYFGDVGLPGPDHGKGGKFLVLPPGDDGAAPEGYFVYRSGTNNLFVFLRGFYEDPENLAPAVEHLEKTRIYPLNLPESATALGNIVPRVFMDDIAEDRAAIQPLVNQIVAYPLSQFDGKMKTIEWSKLPDIPNPDADSNGEVQWIVPEKYFD